MEKREKGREKKRGKRGYKERQIEKTREKRERVRERCKNCLDICQVKLKLGYKPAGAINRELVPS